MASKPASAAPVYYADQPASIGLGGQVSRLTFGLADDDEGEFPTPVVTVVLPTTALVSMVSDLARTFSEERFKKELIASLEEMAKAIAAGINLYPSLTKVAAKSPSKRLTTKSVPKPVL